MHLDTQIEHLSQHPTIPMNAVRVTSWTAPPEHISVPSPPAPSPSQLQLKVLSVGIPPVVRLRARGLHPTVRNAVLPFDPSIDGVGQDGATGDLYYITPLAAPLLAERANVERCQVVKLEDGVDPATVAGLMNPVSSSWMALRCRVNGGCQGRTVVIVGATSASGRAAAIVARYLGARRIIGISRNQETLAGVEGLDDRVLLSTPFVLPPDIGPLHIILDYVGGTIAAKVLETAEVEPGIELQYIQVGGLAAEETPMLKLLPPHLISSKPICIRGSGMGSFTKQDLKNEMDGLIGLITKMERPFEILGIPLSDVQSAWKSEEVKPKRLVVLPHPE
jgi:NADPH:quinone reductase-like Zn-dependent oxidoreductase